MINLVVFHVGGGGRNRLVFFTLATNRNFRLSIEIDLLSVRLDNIDLISFWGIELDLISV